MVLTNFEWNELKSLEGMRLNESFDSVISNDDHAGSDSTISSASRESPFKDTTNILEVISLHNPNMTYKREAIIQSHAMLMKEREYALGKKTIEVDAENYKDYYGRNKVKRCRSNVSASTVRVPKKVKRTYSVIHRYDPSSQRVVKEYKYKVEDKPRVVENNSESNLFRCRSEPSVAEKTDKKQKKAKRTFTNILNMKNKFLNIFTAKC